jgi:hypothetical protein
MHSARSRRRSLSSSNTKRFALIQLPRKRLMVFADGHQFPDGESDYKFESKYDDSAASIPSCPKSSGPVCIHVPRAVVVEQHCVSPITRSMIAPCWATSIDDAIADIRTHNPRCTLVSMPWGLPPRHSVRNPEDSFEGTALVCADQSSRRVTATPYLGFPPELQLFRTASGAF